MLGVYFHSQVEFAFFHNRNNLFIFPIWEKKPLRLPLKLLLLEPYFSVHFCVRFCLPEIIVSLSISAGQNNKKKTLMCATSIAFGSNEGVLSTSAMLLPSTTQPAATPTRLLNYLINLFRGRTTELFTGNLKQLAGPREQPFILSTQKLRSKRC